MKRNSSASKHFLLYLVNHIIHMWVTKKASTKRMSWKIISFSSVIHSSHSIELIKDFKWTNESFFLRPEILLRLIAKLKSISKTYWSEIIILWFLCFRHLVLISFLLTSLGILCFKLFFKLIWIILRRLIKIEIVQKTRHFVHKCLYLSLSTIFAVLEIYLLLGCWPWSSIEEFIHIRDWTI